MNTQRQAAWTHIAELVARPVFVEGRWEQDRSERGVAIVDPAVGEPVAEFREASAEQVEEAVAAARRAQRVWERTPGENRARALGAWLDRIEAQRSQFASVVSAELGPRSRCPSGCTQRCRSPTSGP